MLNSQRNISSIVNINDRSIAPIVLFVYNRPEHTRKTLEALAKNDLAEQSTLYIIADGPKENITDDQFSKIKETRNIIKERLWCKEVLIEEKEENWGLANSIVKGVTEIVNKYGSIIVLEDDIVPERGFLKYMNEALSLYKDNEKVMHISAYIYPYNKKCNEDTLFLNILTCWGWATWKRAWQYYDGDTDTHLKSFHTKAQIKKFNIEGHANYYEQLILNKIGHINSWAVKWYASWLKKGGFSLAPSYSIIKNIGLDGTGVHKDNTSLFNNKTVNQINVTQIPLIENTSIRNEINKFYKKVQKDYLNPKRFINMLTLVLKRNINIIFLLPIRKVLLKILPELKNNTAYKMIIVSSDISERAKVYSPCTIRESIIGKYSYISQNAIINNTKIGKFCSIGPNLICGWGIHPTNAISTSPMFYSTAKQNGMTLSNYDKIKETKTINIGHDVFIGMNVSILDGVSIGNGAIIGAGAVVSKDIPAYAIAVGNPIQIKRYRFDQETINKLEVMQWWNWSFEDLKKIEEQFFNTKAFIDSHEY
ncbi:MAG: glycosyltransferase [Marinilabiliaceae bacterium]|nr:glycosyltransferase [Marinilabiliaceae bacterium]